MVIMCFLIKSMRALTDDKRLPQFDYLHLDFFDKFKKIFYKSRNDKFDQDQFRSIKAIPFVVKEESNVLSFLKKKKKKFSIFVMFVLINFKLILLMLFT